MDLIEDLRILPLDKSRYLQPKQVLFTQNGIKRTTECVSEFEDVSILIFNSSRKVFVFVKQFRPAIYFCQSQTKCSNNDEEVIDTKENPGHLGVTIELCSGIVDKDIPLNEIAQAEILEECGYSVPLNNIQRVTSFRNGSIVTGSSVTLFFTEVTDSMKTGPGGGLAAEGELIEVVEMSRSQAQHLILDEQVNREAVLLVALSWFFETFDKEKDICI